MVIEIEHNSDFKNFNRFVGQFQVIYRTNFVSKSFSRQLMVHDRKKNQFDPTTYGNYTRRGEEVEVFKVCNIYTTAILTNKNFEVFQRTKKILGLPTHSSQVLDIYPRLHKHPKFYLFNIIVFY